jgi:hypothetical protein
VQVAVVSGSSGDSAQVAVATLHITHWNAKCHTTPSVERKRLSQPQSHPVSHPLLSLPLSHPLSPTVTPTVRPTVTPTLSHPLSHPHYHIHTVTPTVTHKLSPVPVLVIALSLCWSRISPFRCNRVDWRRRDDRVDRRLCGFL